VCLNSELEESLLVLPFSYVVELLRLLRCFVETGYEVELAQRCLGFLLRYLSHICNLVVYLSVESYKRCKLVSQVDNSNL